MDDGDYAEEPTDRAAPGSPQKDRPAARWRSFSEVPTYRFALLFLGFLVGISLVYPWFRLRFQAAFRLLEATTAELVYGILSVFSSDVALVNRTTVSLGNFSVTIVEECAGTYEAFILSAALLAFPTSWSKIGLGFAFGFPLIYAMNILRICTLLVVGRLHQGTFEFMHIYFWQGTMILMVASVWLIWTLFVVRGETAFHRSG